MREIINGLILIRTCIACPEQYDVFDKEGNQVGYLRLRHGYFRAEEDCCGGKTVYEADTKGDGMFESDEKYYHLGKAIEAIKNNLKNESNKNNE